MPEPTVTRKTVFQKHPVGFRGLLIAVVVGVLAISYVVRYRIFVQSLRDYDTVIQDGFAKQEFPFLDQHQITQLGMAHRPGFQPTSSYAHFSPHKADHKTRIGIFGCSFVKGSEAMAGQDFPSHLQRVFQGLGNGEVEILNFGVGAFGVQQSFLLWQYLAGDFDLDYTIYSLYGFHRQRDDTFIMLDTLYAPVHARYVLDTHDLRLIEAAGDDRREASARYFSLIPKLNVLRFDAKTPPQIRALLPFGRTLESNPFYYRADRNQEITELYGRIFDEMADRSRKFLLLVHDAKSQSLVLSDSFKAEVTSIRTSTEKYTWDRSSFFRAPNNHPSALGYLALARETHAVINGSQDVDLPDIEILDSIPGEAAKQPEGHLAEFDEVFLSLNETPAAAFVRASDQRRSSPVSFQSSSTQSLVDVSGIRNTRFIALRGPIPGLQVRLRFLIDGRMVNVEIGTVSLIGEGNVGVLDRHWIERTGDDWRLIDHKQGGALALALISQKEIISIDLVVGETPVLKGVLEAPRGRRARQISWQPAAGEVLTTRGHPRQNATEICAEEGGRICITGAKKGQPTKRWCTRHWRLATVTASTAFAVPTGSAPTTD